MKEIVKYTSYHLINVTTPGPGGGSEGKNDGTNSATSAENPNGLIVRARRKPVVPSGPLASFDTSENGCSGSDDDRRPPLEASALSDAHRRRRRAS